MKNQVAVFEKGKTYEMLFIGDSDLRPNFLCTNRTEKMASFHNEKTGEKLTKKIQSHGDSEYVLGGNYSMAPVIRASRVKI